MGIKIMTPPEEVDKVANALIAKAVLREIVRRVVKTPLDAHYFAVVLHKGVSHDLRSLGYADIAALLSLPAQTVQGYLSEHAKAEKAASGCRFCNGASRQLKALIKEEKKRKKGADPFSVFAPMATAPPSLGWSD